MGGCCWWFVVWFDSCVLRIIVGFAGMGFSLLLGLCCRLLVVLICVGALTLCLIMRRLF